MHFEELRLLAFSDDTLAWVQLLKKPFPYARSKHWIVPSMFRATVYEISRLNGSRTKAILGRAAEGYKDIEEAYHIAPDDPVVLLAFSQSLRLQGDATGAMEVLRRVPVASIPYHGQMMLAMLLIERGNASDYREAADICSGLAKLPEGMKADFREHVAEVALDALAKDSRIQDGHILLEQLPKNAVSQIGLSTLRAKLCMLEDKQELAALTADEAFKTVSETTSPHDLRRLAVLLSELGRHKPTVCFEVMSLMTSSCGQNRSKSEPRVAQ